MIDASCSDILLRDGWYRTSLHISLEVREIAMASTSRDEGFMHQDRFPQRRKLNWWELKDALNNKIDAIKSRIGRGKTNRATEEPSKKIVKSSKRFGKGKFTKKRTNLNDDAATGISTHNVSVKSEQVAGDENLPKVIIFKSFQS